MDWGTRSEAERFYQSLVGGVADERAELFYESLVGEAETADEATPTAPRDISKDAFFEEERVRAQIIVGNNPINPATGVTINKYDAPLAIRAWKTHRTDLPNPLQDKSIALQLEPGRTIFSSEYTIFRPTGLALGSTATEEIPVAIFAGPGAELNRHGPSPVRPDQLDKSGGPRLRSGQEAGHYVLQRRFPQRLYASVVRPGTVGAGDTIEILD